MKYLNTIAPSKLSNLCFSTLFILLAIFQHKANAQNLNSSPYSRFGLGDLQFNNSAIFNAMGGASVAYLNDSMPFFFTNISNPASHGSLMLTNFDVGVKHQLTQIKNESSDYLSNKTSLGYITFGFPIKKWWGSSFGLLPYSSVGYDIATSGTYLIDTTGADSVGKVSYSYKGDGGINELYWANGFKIKKFYFGLHASFYFGGISTISRDSFPDISNTFATRVTKTNDFRDFNLRAGIIYNGKINSKWSYNLGANASLERELNAKNTVLIETIRYRFSVESTRDTVLYQPDVATKAMLPAMYAFGFSLRKTDKLTINGEYAIQNWSNFSDLNQPSVFANSNKISLGFSYVQDRFAGKRKYFKRVTIRGGFRYANSMLQFYDNEQITDMALTIGGGFPLRITKVNENFNQAILNLSVELGKRGTVANSLLQENYVRFILGFSINEKWFIQRRYD